MTTVLGKNRCITCGKDRATLRCGGCLQELCFNHSLDHRQELNKQLDEIETTCDLFRQTLTEQTTDPQKHSLIQQINDWERNSLNKIRQTAEEARKKVLEHTNQHFEQIEIKVNELTKQFQQSREENDFYETDLRYWNEELTRLSKELVKPSNINLRQDNSAFINKISVDITSSKSTTKKKKMLCCRF